MSEMATEYERRPITVEEYARMSDLGIIGPPYGLIECADTSLSYNRGKKLRAYARADVREYWIVNVREWCVEVNRDPHALGYGRHEVRSPGDVLALEALPECVFRVEELLGPRLPAPPRD